MVQLAVRGPLRIYVVLEGDRAIGQVVAPAGEPTLGPGAGTVLLRGPSEAAAGGSRAVAPPSGR